MKSKSLILTQPYYPDEGMKIAFEKEGFSVYHYPLIEIKALDFDLEEALEAIHQSDYLIFTSKNAVQYFLSHSVLVEAIKEKAIRLLSIGKTTSRAIENKGLNVYFSSPVHNSKAFLLSLQKQFSGQSASFLLVLGRLAPSYLQDALSQEFRTHRIDCYTTEILEDNKDDLRAVLKQAQQTYLIFTSPSAVRSFAAQTIGLALAEQTVVSIGPATSEALSGIGIKHYQEAKTSSYKGILETIINIENNGISNNKT